MIATSTVEWARCATRIATEITKRINIQVMSTRSLISIREDGKTLVSRTDSLRSPKEKRSRTDRDTDHRSNHDRRLKLSVSEKRGGSSSNSDERERDRERDRRRFVLDIRVVIAD